MSENVLRCYSTRLLQQHEDEWPVGKAVVGLRFDRIEVRLAMKDLHDPEVHRWLSTLTTRASYIPTFRISIEVTA